MSCLFARMQIKLLATQKIFVFAASCLHCLLPTILVYTSQSSNSTPHTGCVAQLMSS